MKVTWPVALGLLSAFSVAFGAVRVARPGRELVPESQAYAEPGEGAEIAVILFVGSRCSWSNQPDLVSAWHAIAGGIETSPPEAVDRVTRIGIGMAGSPREGTDFLQRFGDFHEISVGRPLNSGTLRYVANDLRGPESTPQIIVVKRRFAVRDDGTLFRDSEEVVQRLVGLDAIVSAAGRSLDHPLGPGESTTPFGSAVPENLQSQSYAKVEEVGNTCVL